MLQLAYLLRHRPTGVLCQCGIRTGNSRGRLREGRPITVRLPTLPVARHAPIQAPPLHTRMAHLQEVMLTLHTMVHLDLRGPGTRSGRHLHRGILQTFPGNQAPLDTLEGLVFLQLRTIQGPRNHPPGTLQGLEARPLGTL